MTFEEAIKKYEKIRRPDWKSGRYITMDHDGFIINECKVYVAFNILVFADDWEEYKPEILDKEEKEYLRAVVKPFRNRVKYVTKATSFFDPKECAVFIFIETNKGTIGSISLPYFTNGDMYKGMKTDKNYTLKELGL